MLNSARQSVEMVSSCCRCVSLALYLPVGLLGPDFNRKGKFEAAAIIRRRNIETWCASVVLLLRFASCAVGRKRKEGEGKGLRDCCF